MVEVESFIKLSAEQNHGALYGEWAKKEECWTNLKNQQFSIDLDSIKSDFEDTKNPIQRKRITDEENNLAQIQEEIEKIRSIPPSIWRKIEEWGSVTGELSEPKKTVAFNLAARVRNNSKISDYERQSGSAIIDLIIEKAPELLDEIDEINEKNKIQVEKPDITIDIVKK